MIKRVFNTVLLASVILLISTSCKTENPLPEDLLTVDYIESDSAILNPERGFYSQIDYYSSNKNTPLTASTLSAQRYLGRTLIFTMYYLDQFKNQPISDDFLSLIDSNMKAIREGGSKCILRFAYSSSENDKPWDAPQDIVSEHIQQLAPYLKEYSDIIYVMQAGFIGVWGEWYYTTNFIMSPTSDSDYVPRRTVLNALLSALPKERMICVRTPAIKLNCFSITYADTITSTTAYNESDLSRIACHNDCFLANSSDMGTFINTNEMAFWEQESKYAAMGGETCAPSSYSECSNALLQMEKYHWSYLNSGYHGTVLNDWRTTGCMDEINKRLGYRLVLVQGKYTKTPVAGTDFISELTIKNVGFAAPVNPRGLELVFVSQVDSSDKIVFNIIDQDPRLWIGGGTYTIKTKNTLPNTMKGKDYDVFLNLPDPEGNLYNRSEYSIELANKNVWNKTSGFNKLLSITVN